MHFWKFLAINDDRLDIGDTVTYFVADPANSEVKETSIELASGVSLAASAALLLASASVF